MSITLIHTLVRASLMATGSDWVAIATQKLGSATELEWKQSLVQLELHRLIPLVLYSLKTHGLTDTVPQPYLIQMQDAYRQTLVTNTFLLHTLNRILQAMGERNVHPVLWKGVVLADSFYPDPGMRLMGDIDFAVEADAMEEVTAAFKLLGFLPLEHKATADATYFATQTGVKVLCDVHHRVRLFEGKESMNLIVKLKSKRMTMSTLTVLEPNAMVAHSIVHMDGHRSETGRLLCWILDLAFVMRKSGVLLELERLEKLLPAEHLVSLFRTIRFLQQEFDERLPEPLTYAAKKFEPFTLAEVLRERRLALWGLPRPLGWLRLSACQLALRSSQGCPYPNVSDLLLWPVDALKNQRVGNRLVSQNI